ncbi:hypothetical protein GX48_00223 [Paracoccidioides brasiliensis]|nr:hypothetical protein GX48_00223 [Paracoccidioides brasiliensis]
MSAHTKQIVVELGSILNQLAHFIKAYAGEGIEMEKLCIYLGCDPELISHIHRTFSPPFNPLHHFSHFDPFNYIKPA